MKFSATVKQLPELNVACVRHIGPYPQIGKAIEKIMAWAGPKGLVRFPSTKLLAVYHDDPKCADPAQLRSDACITVPEGTRVDGDIRLMKIPGGAFAIARVEIDQSQYAEAWDRLIGEWIPQNGHQSDTAGKRYCYEVYLNDPNQHPQKKHIAELCEPIAGK